jgi:ribosome-binding protein aMBF1 (putative translation factor)
VKVEKKEWNACPDCYSVGNRVPLIRVFDLKNKCAIRINNSFFSTGKSADVPQDIAEDLATKMDNGTIYTGWIGASDPSHNTIRIDIYERLLLPCTGLTSISWSSGGFMSPSASVTISTRNRAFHYSVDDIIKSMADPTVLDISFRFSPEPWNTFVLPAFHKCNFMAWADGDRYCDPFVFDGQQWQMTIRQGRKIAKNISGSNDYPEEWGIFMRFVSACLELYKPEGDYDDFYGSMLRYPLDIECSVFRERHNMTRKKLAGMLGVRAKDVSEWENGTSKPDGLTLMKLYERIDMSTRYDVHAVFDGEDDEDEIGTQTDKTDIRQFFDQNWMITHISHDKRE